MNSFEKQTNLLYFSHNLHKLLLHESDFEPLIRMIISSFYSLEEFDFVWILLFDKDLNFESFLSEGLNESATEFQKSLFNNNFPVSIKQVIESENITIFKERQSDCPLPIDFSTHTHVIKPLISQNHKYGLLGASIQTQSVWSEDNYRFLGDLSDDISHVIRRLTRSNDLKQIIDDTEDGFLIFDSKLNIVDANEAFFRITGFHRGEILGENGILLVNRYFGGVYLKMMLKAAKRILSGKAIKSFEVILNNKILSISTNFERLSQTRIAVVKDITELRKGELAIKQSEEKYRNLVNALQDFVFIIQDDVIKLVNDTLTESFDYTENELVGSNFYKFIAPEEIEQVREIHQKRIQGLSAPSVYESVVYTKAGRRIPVEVSIVSIEYELKPAWQVVMRDISEQKNIQHRIETARKELEKAQKIGNMGSWTIDINNHQVIASEQAYKIYGLDKKIHKLDLSDIQKIPLLEYREILDQALRKLIDGKGKYDVEFKIKNKKSGQILDIHSIAEYDQETNLVSGTIQNITARKRVEEELKETLSELYNAQKLADIGSWKIDLNKQQYLASEVTRNIYGFEANEIISHELIEKIHMPQHREKLNHALNKLIKGEAAFNEHYELKNKKTGEILFIHSSAEFDKNKNLVKGVLRDLTESKKSEKKLIEIANNFSNIFNVNHDTISILDMDGRIKEVNQTFIDRLGYSRDELIGQSLMLIDKNTSYELVKQNIADICKNQKILEFEAIHTTKSGHSFPVEVQAKPIIYNGEPSILGVTRDITERVKNYQILEENEEKFRSIFENKGTASAILDEEGYILLANEQFATLSGYSREEIENGMSWGSLVHPDDYMKLAEQQPIRNPNPQNTLKAYEVRMLNKNEEVKHVLINIGITKNRQRIASFVDITERKMAEESLREQKNFSWLLIDNMPIQIYWKNRDLVFKGGNLAFAEVVGLSSPKRVKGKTDLDFVRRADYNEDYRKWETEVMKSATPMYNHEEAYFRADGTQGIALTSRIPLLNNRKDVEGVLVFSVDITQMKKAAEELSRSEAKFKSYIEGSPYGVFVVDEKGKYLEVNEACSQLTGYTKDEFLNLSYTDLLISEEAEYVKNAFVNMVQNKVPVNIEIQYRRKNGEIRMWDVNTIQIGENRYLGFSHDITRRKQNEKELLLAKTKAEESDRLKSAFLATVSHELRTPLNHILGFSDLIPELTRDSEIIEFSNYINRSGQYLMEIIEDIFNLAMIEQKQIKIRQTEVFLRDIFIELKKQLQEALADANKTDVIELDFNIEKDLVNQKVITDKPKILQAVSNILKNAVKYTHQGKISLKVELHANQLLKIVVSDTGIGIPEDKLNIIFDFFRQVDDSHTREYGGVGIGLALARKIADAMNGEIEVTTRVKEGSVFVFKVPVSGVIKKEETLFIPDKTTQYPDFSRKQILVVEDDVTSMELITILLKPLKCKVIKAWNGSEAVNIIRSNNDIDLVFMDLKMPVMDGFLSTMEIRKINKEVPVVALTAHALSSEKKRALDAGCNDLITKPINKNLLYKLLEIILR